MSSSTYSRPTLEKLWVEAGGAKNLAPTMAAIALAESSGNPDAHNPSGASGLWQIMVPVNSSYIPGGAKNVYSPRANAAAAVKILKSQGLGAWETYTNGAYKQHLPKKGEKTVASGGLPLAVVGAPNGLIGDAMKLLSGAGTTAVEQSLLGPGSKGVSGAAGKSAGEAATGLLTGELGKLLLPLILLAAGAYLVVYGIMVAVRPRETALRPINPLADLPVPVPV